MGRDFNGAEYVDVGDCACVPLKKVTPILRPLSDLYKTITHNGGKIIPIMELAKIAGKELNLQWVIDNGDIRVHGWEDDPDRFEYIFCYSDIFKLIELNWSGKGSNIVHYADQWPLYEYLHELKIDHRGLIPAGLAIDCNTLENNPYK
jgi:hypothetical protein